MQTSLSENGEWLSEGGEGGQTTMLMSHCCTADLKENYRWTRKGTGRWRWVGEKG